MLNISLKINRKYDKSLDSYGVDIRERANGAVKKFLSLNDLNVESPFSPDLVEIGANLNVNNANTTRADFPRTVSEPNERLTLYYSYINMY